MSQLLSITIDGKDGRVAPESVGNVLRAVFALLHSLDEQSWPVETRRVRWRVTQATLVNPLTITASGEPLSEEFGEASLAIPFVEQLLQIDRGVRPKNLSDKHLKWAKILGYEARRSRSLVIAGVEDTRAESISVPKSFSAQVNKIIRQPKRIVTEYGSLDGTLIHLSNDPLKDDGKAKLRERLSTNEVHCHAEPDVASRMGQYMNRETRVVLYGTITYEDGVARRIDVEDLVAIPREDQLPTLGELHAMKLRPPGGRSVEDFLSDLRGDDD